MKYAILVIIIMFILVGCNSEVVTNDEVEYEILSEKIARPPYDSVVYVVDVPDTLDEQEIYVIRSVNSQRKNLPRYPFGKIGKQL
jgi:hypothetical protein